MVSSGGRKEPLYPFLAGVKKFKDLEKLSK
jgi:hypothetical protein